VLVKGKNFGNPSLSTSTLLSAENYQHGHCSYGVERSELSLYDTEQVPPSLSKSINGTYIAGFLSSMSSSNNHF
jgi:hypothetical protein